jgi:hypothetical protein
MSAKKSKFSAALSICALTCVIGIPVFSVSSLVNSSLFFLINLATSCSISDLFEAEVLLQISKAFFAALTALSTSSLQPTGIVPKTSLLQDLRIQIFYYLENRQNLR